MWRGESAGGVLVTQKSRLPFLCKHFNIIFTQLHIFKELEFTCLNWNSNNKSSLFTKKILNTSAEPIRCCKSPRLWDMPWPASFTSTYKTSTIAVCNHTPGPKKLISMYLWGFESRLRRIELFPWEKPRSIPWSIPAHPVLCKDGLVSARGNNPKIWEGPAHVYGWERKVTRFPERMLLR